MGSESYGKYYEGIFVDGIESCLRGQMFGSLDQVNPASSFSRSMGVK
jgi:hypothetical protein